MTNAASPIKSAVLAPANLGKWLAYSKACSGFMRSLGTWSTLLEASGDDSANLVGQGNVAWSKFVDAFDKTPGNRERATASLTQAVGPMSFSRTDALQHMSSYHYENCVAGRLVSTLTSSADLAQRRPYYLAIHDSNDSEGWRREFSRLDHLAELPIGWDGEDGLPAEQVTIRLVKAALLPCTTLCPVPSFSTGGEGDVWALWASHGLDIELHFTADGAVFAMIEDDRGVVPKFENEDPDLERTFDALFELGERDRRAAHELDRDLPDIGMEITDQSAAGSLEVEWPVPAGTITMGQSTPTVTE